MPVIKNYSKDILSNFNRVIDISYFLNNKDCNCNVSQFGIDFEMGFDNYIVTLHVNCSLMCNVDAVVTKTKEKVFASYMFMIGTDESIEETRSRFAKFLETYFNISIY